MAQKKDWREQGVRVVTSERLDFDTAQTNPRNDKGSSDQSGKCWSRKVVGWNS